MRLVTTIILLLKFRRWYVADRFEKPPVVEPVDPFERSKLHRFDVAPRSASADNLGLVEPNDRFGEGIVVRISGRSHRSLDTALGKPFAVADGQILGGFNRSLQHFKSGGGNDEAKTIRSGGTGQAVLAREAAGGAARGA